MVGPFGFHPNKTMRSRALKLAQALTKRGHQLHLLLPPWQTPQEAGRHWQEGGVEITYTTLSGGVVGITGRLIRATLAWRPHVIHCFKPKAYSGLVAWWLWRFHRSRLRLVTDSDDWEGWGGWNDLAPYTPLQKRFFAWQERWGMGHCHTLTVASRALESLAWANGVPPAQVTYLPNGPGIGDDTSQAAARRIELGLAGRPTILLYSRLFELDTARLVAVLRRVQADVPDLAVLVVGASLYEKDATQFQQQLGEAGLAEAMVAAGWLAEAALPSTLAAADVGLYLMDDTLLNRTKCPVKLADMLNVGLPVVAEGVGQTPEYVVHQQTGRLYASGDVDGVAAGLIALLQDVETRGRLGRGAKAHLEKHFSWERLAETAERAYDYSLPSAMARPRKL